MDPISYKKAKEAKELAEQIVEGEVETGVLRTKIDEKLSSLEEQYAPELNQVKSQLAQRAQLKIFNDIPTVSDLKANELGLVLIPLFPFEYSFDGTTGLSWDKFKFKTTKYEAKAGLLNQSESVSKLNNNTGLIKVSKGTPAGLCVVDNLALLDLDLTNHKKYRVAIDIKNSGVSGTSFGNCGISFAQYGDYQSFYPTEPNLLNGYSVFLTPNKNTNEMRVSVRKIISRSMVLNKYLASSGGYATTTNDRLIVPTDEFSRLEIEISTSSVKLSVNGVEYLDVAEDLSILNRENVKIALWGATNDENSTVVEHYFDNFLVEEVD